MDVVVYRLTGRQVGFSVPDWCCPECELTVAAVRAAVERAGIAGVRVTVKPWLRALAEALRHGGWHPPVVVVDGRRYCQGRVPDVQGLAEHLKRCAQGRAAP